MRTVFGDKRTRTNRSLAGGAWVLAGTLEFPSGIAGEEDLRPLFARLPGFDHRKVIEASSSSVNATFLCWTRGRQDSGEPAAGGHPE